jgi:outer membrane protein, heavy metal efflux system
MQSITRRVSMQGIWIQVLAALLAMTAAVWARADGLTLEQAVQQSLSRNPELQAARYAMDVAYGRLQQAGLWPNPRLQFENESDKPYADNGEFSRNLGFSQDFPIAGRIKRQKDVARVDVALVLAEINDAERRLAGLVAGRFYAAVTIDRGIALRNELIDIEQSLVDVTRNRLKAGEVSELDVNTVTLELERLTAERDVLLGDQGVAAAELAVSLGLPVPYKLELDPTLPPIGPQLALPVLESRAFATRPDLRIRTLETDRARAEQALARASAWEDWTIGLGVQQDRIGFDGAPRQSTDNAVLLSVSIPLPLFNRNQGDIAAARGAERQATQGVDALRLVIANEVAATYHQLDRLATTLAAQQQRMLPLSQRNTELARDAYGQGQISIIEVVQVERLRNELRANYLDIYGSYLQNRARLDMATDAWSELATRVSEHPAGADYPEN